MSRRNNTFRLDIGDRFFSPPSLSLSCTLHLKRHQSGLVGLEGGSFPLWVNIINTHFFFWEKWYVMCVLWAAYTFNNRTCVQHFSIYVSPHQCGKSLVYICLDSALFFLFFFSFELLCFFSVGFLLLVCVCTPDKEFHLGGEGDVKKKRVHTDFLLLLLLPRSYWVHRETKEEEYRLGRQVPI